MNQTISNEEDQNNIILCFCKHPVAGLVKSRLAKDIGVEPATEVYKILLDEMINRISCLEPKVFLYCYPDTTHPILKRYETKFNFALEKQNGEDLGLKMHNAMKKHLTPNTNVVLIGTDCLEIDANYIYQAFEYLNSGSDVVLGPAEDGGYALIGANKIDSSIFENIEWSTDQVLSQTKEKIKELDWKYRLLNKVRDLDNLDDYKYFSTHEKYQKLF